MRYLGRNGNFLVPHKPEQTSFRFLEIVVSHEEYQTALQALIRRTFIMEETLRRYILTELAPAQASRALHPDEPLFETVLDSTSILALVTFIEEEFHIEVPDSDVVPQHFSTLTRLSAYIERRSREATSSGTEVSAAGLG